MAHHTRGGRNSRASEQRNKNTNKITTNTITREPKYQERTQVSEWAPVNYKGHSLVHVVFYIIYPRPPRADQYTWTLTQANCASNPRPDQYTTSTQLTAASIIHFSRLWSVNPAKDEKKNALPNQTTHPAPPAKKHETLCFSFAFNCHVFLMFSHRNTEHILCPLSFVPETHKTKQNP